MSAQFNRYTWPFDFFPYYWVTTELVVCLIYTLYEFIVLESSVRFLYLQVSFSVFPSCVHYCCTIEHTLLSHNSSIDQLDYYITFPPEHWLPFLQVFGSNSRWGGLTHVSPTSATTLAFLLNHISADITLLLKLSEWMWWSWPVFLSESDNTASSKFCPLAV